MVANEPRRAAQGSRLELFDHDYVVGHVEFAAEAELARRNEAEARIVSRMAHYDDVDLGNQRDQLQAFGVQ